MSNHDEGWSAIPYYCSNRYPTIGIGRKIGSKGAPLPLMTTTRQIEDAFLQKAITGIDQNLSTHVNTCGTYKDLSEIRKAVLICMVYQMGFAGVLGFRDMWEALAINDYDKAADAMLDSKWHRIDSPKRSLRESEMMRTGLVDKYYA